MLAKPRPAAWIRVFLLASLIPAHDKSHSQDRANDARRDSGGWELLQFDEKRRIVALTIAMGTEVFGENHIDFERKIDDRTTLSDFERGLAALLNRVDFEGALSPPFGFLTIATNTNEVFEIRLYSGGFDVALPKAQVTSRFYSWRLAKEFDDQLRLGGHKGLSKKEFDGLSGERFIEAQKQRYSDDHKGKRQKDLN